MTLLFQFLYLQVLDILTTLAFLAAGVSEANPVVQFSLKVADSPIQALLAVKIVATILALYCWFIGRRRLLRRINFCFAALVIWNLIALVVSSHTHFRA